MSIFWFEQPPDPARPGYRCWHFCSHNAKHGLAWFEACCEIDVVGGLRQTIVTFNVVAVLRDQRMGRLDPTRIDGVEECFLMLGWAEQWAAEKMELIKEVYYDEDGDSIEAFLKAGGITNNDSWGEKPEGPHQEPRRLPPTPEPRREISNSPEPRREERWRHAD